MAINIGRIFAFLGIFLALVTASPTPSTLFPRQGNCIVGRPRPPPNMLALVRVTIDGVRENAAWVSIPNVGHGVDPVRARAWQSRENTNMIDVEFSFNRPTNVRDFWQFEIWSTSDPSDTPDRQLFGFENSWTTVITGGGTHVFCVDEVPSSQQLLVGLRRV